MWAGLFEKGLSEEALRPQIEGVLGAMGLLDPDGSAAGGERRLDQAVQLAIAARRPAQAWAHQQANLSDLQLGVDRAQAKRQAQEVQKDQDLKRLRKPGVFDLPAVWRGKRYQRAEALGDPKAQQKAEDKERTR